MKKRAKIHQLTTDKPSQIAICKLGERSGLFYGNEPSIEDDLQNQHLYFTTDDVIKEGDWCLFFWDGMKDGELGQVGSEPQQYLPSEGHTLNRNLRKIIATTNPKLHSTRLKDCPINPEDNMVSVRGVSKPSQSFIEEYCRKGGIDEVDVEYEVTPSLKTGDNYNIGGEVREVTDVWLGTNDTWYVSTPNNHAWSCPIELKPKVNSDNTINIHPIKDSWTVENLPDLLNRFCKDHSLHRGLQITDDMIKEWLEKQ